MRGGQFLSGPACRSRRATLVPRVFWVSAVVVLFLGTSVGSLTLGHPAGYGAPLNGLPGGGSAFSRGLVAAPLRSSNLVHPAAGSIGSVISTLDLATNTLYSGPASFGIQNGAQIPLFDPLNGMIYVRGGFGSDLSVVNSTTFVDVANIQVPSTSAYTTPTETLALDNKTGYLYATNAGTANVSIISTKTNHVTGSVPVGAGPQGIAFDWARGNFYTANEATDNVTVFSASSNRTIATVHVGLKPTAIVYDHQSRQVFVANWNSANISIINTTTYKHTDLNVGKFPVAFALDTKDDYVDVLNDTGNWGGVRVVAAATNTTHNTFRAGLSAESLAYDPVTNRLFVANGGSNNLTVINQTTGAIVPTGLVIGHGSIYYSTAYDPANGNVYVACFNGGGSGSGNITVVNGATARSVANITTSNLPVGVTTAASGDVYVVNQGPASQAPEPNVTVLNVTNSLPIASVPLYVSPSGVAFDSGENSLYVVDNSGNDIYRVNGSSGSITGVERGGPDPIQSTYVLPLVYDPRNGYIYVVDTHRTAIDVFTSAHVFLKSIPVGLSPTGIAYDSENGTLFVSQNFYGNVSIIDGSTNQVLPSTLKLGAFANLAAVAYDPHNNTVYVANYGADNVTAFNASTYVKLKTIPVGLEPDTFAVDSKNHTVFVGNYGSGNASVINDTTNRVVANPSISGVHLLVYDNGTDSVYNAVYGANSVSAIDASSYAALSGSPLQLGGLGGTYTEGITYDWTNGEVYVTNSDGDSLQAISAAPTYAVTFHETGLAATTPWSVTLGGVLHSASTLTIGFTEVAGTWPYTVHPVSGYAQNVTTGNVVVTTGPKDVYVKFTAVASSYAVTFIESGLPPTSLWNVTLNSVQNHSNTNSIGFVEPTGSYPYTVGRFSGYVANVTSGNAVVGTAALNIYIGFTAVRSAFPVTFIESGLPGSTSWSVTFNHTTNSSSTNSIGFLNANGTWPFTVGVVSGFTANNSSGNVTVSGQPRTILIGFTAVATFAVNFTETGLPASTPWTVTLAGTLKGSPTRFIVFSEPNGVYSFSVGTVTGYSASPNSGSADVTGAPVLKTITFTLGTLALSVQLAANPANITLGASTTLTATTSGGTPPFTYVYIGLPSGCSSQNASSFSCTPTGSGSFTVNVTVTDPHGDLARASTIVKVTNPNGAGGSSSSPISSTEWTLLILVVVGIVLVLLFIVWRRRHQTPAPPPPLAPPPPGAAPPP